MRSLVSILAWGALLACAAIAPADAGQVANLEKLIAGLRELEAAQNRLMNDLSRGVVVMDRLSDGNGLFPIRTAEIREAFRLRIAAEESAKPNPNLDAAEARVIEGANRYIAARRADSRSYMGRLTAELSRVRTARQKAERQRDLLKAQANVPGASVGSFGGTWTSGWGKMVLTQSGSHAMHIRAVYSEGELTEEGTCKEVLQVRQEGR